MKEEKILTFKKDARSKLAEGVEILANAVTTTLGPKGRNVAIQRDWGVPIVVHDGVTVAREVGHKDPFINMGIALVREAAGRTNDEAGDGTTTATLLAREIVMGGMKLIDEGKNPMVLRNEIYDQLPLLIEGIKKYSRPIKTNADIKKVAFISSSDEEIGDLVAKAVETVGEDGLVTAEEGQSFETEVQFTEGIDFNSGFLSPYFITNPQRMECVIQNPAIVLIKKAVSLPMEIGPILEKVAKETKDVVVIAYDVTGDALVTMAVNKQKGNINCVAMKPPMSGQDRDDFFDDIAVATGATPIRDESEATPELEWVGKADKVIVDQNHSVIVLSKEKEKEINVRLEGLKKTAKEAKTKFIREKIENRIAKLARGVAVIKVGAKTDIDMRERVERVKDAIGSATAAREEGVVVGGGKLFLQLISCIDTKSDGGRLLRGILESPIRKLLSNAGVDDEKEIEKIVKQVKDAEGSLGYEVSTGKVVDLEKEGVIDPAKVVRLALENAVAVSTSILTTDCLIASDLDMKAKLVKASPAR